MSIQKRIAALVLGAAAVMMSVGAMAQEKYPLVLGDYWDVTGIKIKDGGGLKYAEFLAGEWKQDAEFSKSKGWIKDYKIFSNPYARPGEPDLYLVMIRENLASGADDEKRGDEYQAWKKKTIAQMESESGNRAEYREVMSGALLQELTIRQ